MGKVALVTGGNQGLGFALVKALCRTLTSTDFVYLTARNSEKGQAARESLGAVVPHLEYEQLDVTDEDSVARLTDILRTRHGGLDIVVSNAAARIVKNYPQEKQVRDFIETNNHGTRRILKYFLPLLHSGARYVIVASSFGQLSRLPTNLHPYFDTEHLSLDTIEDNMDFYVTSVENGTAKSQGWPEWINIPSKIGQVALARIAARQVRQSRPNDSILLNAVCPGLINTEAARPWFDDMSSAQSPDQAAQHLVDLLLLPQGVSQPHGQLLQFGKILPWI